MMEYILKLKTLGDNLATIKESVSDKEYQILQLLRGLGVDYNSIVASITAHEDDVAIHCTHNILLTHEQWLNFQNSIAEDESISANVAISQGKINNIKFFNNKGSTHYTNKNNPANH